MAIFTTLKTSSEPRLTLSSPSFGTSHLLCTSVRSQNTTSITALALDQSRPPNDNHTRVASFLATGEFTIFSINHAVPSTSSPVLKYVPSSITTRNSPIIQAAYHHPLLITLSESFRLSLYDLSDDKVSHTQTLSSFTSYPPSSLVLSCPSATAYKLVLAYAIPVYPAHWSVGATELMISPSPVMSVSSTRTTKAFDIPPGWVDEQKMQAVREQWSRKVSRVADTQTDGKWVVLAPGSSLSTPSPHPATSPESSSLAVAPSSQSPSSLQLYRLYLPASTSLSSVPKLTFVRTLHGHMGPISSLALADGRCVSLGVNGSIWVWDLEGGTGAQVSASCVEAQIPLNGLNVKGSIAFDERRIIVADVGGVMMRRFDV